MFLHTIVVNLRHIGYYRFSAYLYPLLTIPKENHVFKPGAAFNQALPRAFLCRFPYLCRGLFVKHCNFFSAIAINLRNISYLCTQKNKYDNVMTAITINIPNHEVSFFKKMIAKMGWTYSEADVVRSAATPKEQALAKVDHAFGQLRQMKDGKLQGINAEDLLNEL